MTYNPEKLGIEDLYQAQARIAGHSLITPLLRSPVLEQRLGATVAIKAENLQRCGAFKFRGAFNRLSQLNDAEKSNGVVAFSSGNHAQGVAMAAHILGIPATIVMPRDAPEIKIRGTKAFGAEIRFYDRYKESRETIAQAITEDQGRIVVPPFDDPHIIAGQGTCGLELAAQARQQQLRLDMLLAPCGGGGLIAGLAVALKHLLPSIEIYSVEPQDFDDHRRSLLSGRREQVDPRARSFCDALLSPAPGELTWAINQQYLDAGLAVSDDEIAHAISFAYHHLKLVTEPGGAAALAALLSGKLEVRGKTVAIVLSGGNIEPETFNRCLQQYPQP